MKPIGAFSFFGVLARAVGTGVFFAGASLPWASAAIAPRFAGEPFLERFAGGALEVSASVDCPDPVALAGARVDFGLDFDLDGVYEPAGSSALYPGDCEGGALAVRRGLFPRGAAPLRLELRDAADSLRDAREAFAGEAGSLLALHRFCARPRDGEPEWVEIANVSSGRVSLDKIRLDGRALSGVLEAGASVTVAGASDTAELRAWRPGARVFATTSWSSLRNTGDTVRLALTLSGARTAVIDSVVYGSGASPREACASAAAETAAGEAHGFALSAPREWRPRRGNLEVEVRAPSQARYRLRVYDLDGLERCPSARGVGPARFVIIPGACDLSPAPPALLLLLQPTGAPPTRARVRLRP